MPIDRNSSISPTATDYPSRAWFLCIVAITALGGAIRLAALDTHSFWYDEAVSANLAQSSASDLLLGAARDNGNPPLYWLFAKASRFCLGESEWSYRLAPATFAIVSIPLIAVLGLLLAGPASGLAAALLLALSPLSLELSTEARAYSLLHLLSIASTIAFILWIRKRSLGWAMLYLGSMSLLYLNHYYAIFVPMAHLVTLIARHDLRRLLPAWLAIMACSAALCSFWIPTFITQLSTPGNLSRHEQGWVAQFLATPLSFAVGRTLVWRSDPEVLLAAASICVLGTFWLCVGFAVRRARRLDDTFVLLAAWLLLPLALPALAAVAGKPLYHIRAASVAMPAFLLMVAIGFTTVRLRTQAILGTVMAILVAISLTRFFLFPLKDDWRSAVPCVAKNVGKDDILVFDSDIEWVSFAYYARQQHFLPERMYAVVGGLGKDGNLRCLRTTNGVLEEGISDFTPEILDAKRVFLLCCVPSVEPEEYIRYFSEHGFHVDRDAHFHRIDLIHFTREKEKE